MEKRRHIAPLPGLDERESEVYHDLRRLYPEAPHQMIVRNAIAVASRERRAERARHTLWVRIKRALGWA